MKSTNFVKFVYSSIRQLYCCDITYISTMPPERAAYNKLTNKNVNDVVFHPASRNIKYRKFHVEQFSTGQKIKNLMPQKGQSLVNQT